MYYHLSCLLLISCVFGIALTASVIKFEKNMKKLFLIQSDQVDSAMVRHRITIEESLSLSCFITEIQSALQTKEDIRLEVFDVNENRFVPVDFENAHIVTILQENRPSHLLAHFPSKENEGPSSTLMIKCRQFDVSNGLHFDNGGKVYVSEPGQASLGTGLTSWDGSVVLAKYFEYHPEVIRSKRILEVGAGTGIAGMAASLLGAQTVLLTDLPYTLANLEHNVQITRNANPMLPMSIEVGCVDWKQKDTYPIINSHWDLIIGADVVWLQDLVIPLVNTLHECAVSRDTVIYLAHQTRSKLLDEYLFEQLAKYFQYEVVDRKDYHPQYNSSLVYIIKIFR